MIAAFAARVLAALARADPYKDTVPIELPTVTTTIYEPPPRVDWHAQEQRLLAKLADLTAKKGVSPLEAARRMDWSRT